MKLLILFGPPAVGKATVGRIIAKQTDFRLFHNHMVMDGVIELFGAGTPAEDRLSRLIRSEVIKEAAASNMNLIFTYAWNFGSDKGRNNIDLFKSMYKSRGGEVIFVELKAALEDRMLRAETPERKQTKAHAPNATRVAYLDSICDYTSPSPFFFDNYLSVDTSGKTADMVASEVISAISQQVTQPIPNSEPKQRVELIDDNARKFFVNPIDYVFLENNSATRYLIETDWLIIGQDSEKKVVRKQFENGDVQMLLISKVTIDGKRTAKKEKLPKNSTTNIGLDLFVM